jgi:hypothetical protein
MLATEIRSSTDDDNLAHVWFANPGERSSQYVTLCRELDDHTSDSVYVERDDQKWSSHGGIDKAMLTRHSLVLSFSEDSSNSLGASWLDIQFEIEDESFGQLKDALTAIFEGHSGFVVV